MPEPEPVTASELLQKVRDSRAEVKLVNVWATWCQPCREEFPDLLRLRRAYDRSVLATFLVSADFPDQRGAVKTFLSDHGVDFGTYIKTGKDMEFIDTLLPKWTGALPATFVYDADGRLRFFWEGEADLATFRERVEKARVGQPEPPEGGSSR